MELEQLRNEWLTYLDTPHDASSIQDVSKAKIRQLKNVLRTLQAYVETSDSINFREDSQLCHVGGILVTEFEADLATVSRESNENDLTLLHDYLTRGRGALILQLLSTFGISELTNRHKLAEIVIWTLRLYIQFNTCSVKNVAEMRLTEIRAFFSTFLCDLKQCGRQAPDDTADHKNSITSNARSGSDPSTLLHKSQECPRSHHRHWKRATSVPESDSDDETPLVLFPSTTRHRQELPPLVYDLLSRWTETVQPSAENDDSDRQLPAVDVFVLLLTLLKHVINDDIKCIRDTPICTHFLRHLGTFLCTVVREFCAVDSEQTGHLLSLTESIAVVRCTWRVFIVMLLRICEQNNGLTWLRRCTVIDEALDAIYGIADTLHTTVDGKQLLVDTAMSCWLFTEGLLLRHQTNMVVIGTACRATEVVTRRRGMDLTEWVLLKLITVDSGVETTDDTCRCLLDLLKSIVSVSRLLKVIRARYMHWCSCSRRSHRRCNVIGRNSVYRHHHDALGMACCNALQENVPLCVGGDFDAQLRFCRSQTDICMVSNIQLLLLGIYCQSPLLPVHHHLLEVFSRGFASCCCVPPSLLLAAFCRDNSCAMGRVRRKSVSVLLEMLVSDCGGGGSLDHCVMCSDAEVSQQRIDGRLASSSSSFSAAETIVSTVERWQCVAQLTQLAYSQDASFTVHVITQVAHIAEDCTKSLCLQLYHGFFMPILLPTAKQLTATPSIPTTALAPFPISVAPSVVRLCLSALRHILHHSLCFVAFLNADGIQLITQLVDIEAVRHCALMVLEVLVNVSDLGLKSESGIESAKLGASNVIDEQDGNLNHSQNFDQPQASNVPALVDKHLLSSEETSTNAALDSMISLVFGDWENNDWCDNLFDSILSEGNLLARTSDLWHVTSKLFATSFVFQRQFVARNGPHLASMLLYAASRTFLQLGFGPVSMDKRVAIFYGRDHHQYLAERNWLMLVRSTLSVCLTCTQHGVYFTSEEVFIDELLAYLITNIDASISAGPFQLFCEMLLLFVRESDTESQLFSKDCVVSESLITEESASDHETSVSPEQRTSSCEPDECREPGYEADRELSSDENRDYETLLCNVSQQHSSTSVDEVIHPQLCKLVLQLTAAYHHVTDQSTDVAIVTNILFWLVSLAQKSYPTAACMCRQGLSHVFLTEFRKFLITSAESARVIQRLVLELFLLIAQHGATASDLKLLLQLFDVEQAPTDILLSVLISLSISIPLEPTYSLHIPVTQPSNDCSDSVVSYWSPTSDHVDNSVFRDVVVVNDDKHCGGLSLTATLRGSGEIAFRSLLSTRKSSESVNEKGAIAVSPAKCAPLEVSLDSIACWPSCPTVAFSVAFWLMVENTGRTNGISKSVLHQISNSLMEIDTSAETSRSRPGQGGKTGTFSGRRMRWSDMCLHLVAVGNAEIMFELWLDSSTSHFIARLVSHSSGSAVIVCQTCIPSHLTRGNWHYVTVTYKETSNTNTGNNDVEVVTFVDGVNHSSATMDYKLERVPNRLSSNIYIGHSRTADQQIRCAQCCQLGNLFMFNDFELTRAMSLYLYSLGPDCCTLAECDSSEQVFVYTHHISRALSKVPDLVHELLISSRPPFLEDLRASLVLMYTPQYPKVCTFINKSASSVHPPSSSSARPPSLIKSSLLSSYLTSVPVISSDLLKVGANSGTLASLRQLGGIKTWLFLFAKIVEQKKSECEQAKALRLIFSLIHRDIGLTHEFLDCDGYSMIAKVCMTSRCRVGYEMLKVFVNASVNIPIMYYNDARREYGITSDNTAVICDLEVIFKVILVWHIWEAAADGVWVMAFRALNSLVRVGHPHQHYNIDQLHNAGIISQLLDMCKERLQEGHPSLPVSVCQSLLELVQTVVKQHLTMDNVVHMCDFLLLMHPAACTYVFQNKTSFCFRNKWIESSAGSMSVLHRSDTFERQSALTSDFEEGTSGTSTDSKHMEDSSHSSDWVFLKRDITHVTEHDMNSLKQSPFRRRNYARDALHDRGLLSAYSIDTSSDGGESVSDELNIAVQVETKHADDSETATSDKTAKDFERKSATLDVVHSDSPMAFDHGLDVVQEVAEESSASCGVEKNNSNGHQPIQKTDTEVHSAECSFHIEPPSSSVAVGDRLPADAHPDQMEILEASLLKTAMSSDDDKDDQGLVYICTGMLNLLGQLLHLIPDTDRDKLFRMVLRPDMLVAMTNHSSIDIRITIIQFFESYWPLVSPAQKAKFLKQYGFHLLANQLHQYSVNRQLITVCLRLLVKNLDFDELICNDPYSEVDIHDPLLSVLLLSLIERTVTDPLLCHMTLNCVTKLFSGSAEVARVSLQNGLVEILCNVVHLMNLTSPDSTNDLSVNEDSRQMLSSDIQRIFETIAQTAFLTPGESNYYLYEHTFGLLQSLEARQADLHGKDSDVVLFIMSVECHVLLPALEYFDEQLDVLLKRVHCSLSSSVIDTGGGWFGHREENKANNQSLVLSADEMVERFKKIIIIAVNFVIFCLSEQRLFSEKANVDGNVNVVPERNFSEYLLEFLLKAFTTCLQTGMVRKGALITSVLRANRETLRQQLSRLVVHMMSPQSSLSQKLFVLDLLTAEPTAAAVLQNTVDVKMMGVKLAGYLYDLVVDNIDILSKAHRDEVNELISILHNCEVAVIKLGTRLSLDDKAAMLRDRSLWSAKFNDERMKWLQNHGLARQRVLHRLDALLEKVCVEAMEMTQFVSSAQNMLRRKLVNDIKRQMSNALLVKKAWQQTIHQLTHERGVWHSSTTYPPSWQQDPTEGPSRVRRRLQRCHLFMKPEFLLAEHRHKLSAAENELPLSYLFVDDADKLDSAVLIYKLHTSDSIDYTVPCSYVTPQTTTSGSLLVGQTDLFFVADNAITVSSFMQQQALLGYCDTLFMTLPHEQIKEFHKQWYLLNDNAIEIFLTTGRTCLLAFGSAKERDELYTELCGLELPSLQPSDDLSAIQQLWLMGKMTNFDYLMQLNNMAGRTFNDLMQYPIFPFVLCQYDQPRLDLNDFTCYRNLSKTISTQLRDMEQKYVNIYRQLTIERQNDSDDDCDDILSVPYHYSNHCSNIFTILQYLVRLPPFTQLFVAFQDNHFDVPDRTFHSLQRTYQLVTFQSVTDTRELIPEFFYLPEFLENREGFDFGLMQNGDRVDSVRLPPWCHGDARLFTLIHRQALESDHVRQTLPAWIDLVFGFKQRGKAAVDAVNVFHPSSYFGIEVESISDSLKRNAVKTMIRTTGQTPKQLFKAPHPLPLSTAGSANVKTFEKVSPVPQVSGLQWGDYIGSPDWPTPVVSWSSDRKVCPVKLVSLPTGEVFGLDHSSMLLVRESGVGARLLHVNIEWAAIMSWNHFDNIVRIRNRKDHPAVNFFHWTASQQITCSVASSDCRLLFFGCDSGVISVFHTKYNPHLELHLQVFDRRQCLFAHSAAITSLQLCKPFSVLLSASQDGTCVIWDLNSLSYVRSLSDHDGRPVLSMAVSATSGDIVSASHKGDVSCLTLHTINGQLVSSIECADLVQCLTFSPAPEGQAVNMVAAGMISGKIRLWSSWTLTPVRELVSTAIKAPIVSLSYTSDGRSLFCATSDGYVHVWEKPATIRRKLSKFMSYV